MKRFAQILNGKVHYIFFADEKPDLSKDVILVDITNKEEVEEGWDYDIYNKVFSQAELQEEEYVVKEESLNPTQKIEMLNLLVELEVI